MTETKDTETVELLVRECKNIQINNSDVARLRQEEGYDNLYTLLYESEDDGKCELTELPCGRLFPSLVRVSDEKILHVYFLWNCERCPSYEHVVRKYQSQDIKEEVDSTLKARIELKE